MKRKQFVEHFPPPPLTNNRTRKNLIHTSLQDIAISETS